MIVQLIVFELIVIVIIFGLMLGYSGSMGVIIVVVFIIVMVVEFIVVCRIRVIN